MSIIDILDWRFIASYLGLGLVCLLIWRRYLSPISDVPGPFLASLTRLWHSYHYVIGDHHVRLVDLHDKHGRV